MIVLESVSTEIFDDLTLGVQNGELCLCILESNTAMNSLLNIVSGFALPKSGKVKILQQDIYGCSAKDKSLIMSKMAFLLENGGLISNLKIWENVLLPAQYHKTICLSDTEAFILDLLNKCPRIFENITVENFFHFLPSDLPVYLKRVACILRAILCCPKVIICESILEGLQSIAVECLQMLIDHLRKINSNPSILYLTADIEVLNSLKPDTIYKQDKRGVIKIS